MAPVAAFMTKTVRPELAAMREPSAFHVTRSAHPFSSGMTSDGEGEGGPLWSFEKGKAAAGSSGGIS